MMTTMIKTTASTMKIITIIKNNIIIIMIFKRLLIAIEKNY